MGSQWIAAVRYNAAVDELMRGDISNSSWLTRTDPKT